ncbi:MAG: hypothetical protein ACXWKG_16815 [Limisphaerales bacterium]
MHWRTTAWLLLATVMLASADNARWFPTQTFPKSIICTVNQQEFPKPRLAHQMMVQSVAGLAAKAVNEGRGTELVWVNNGEGDLEKWYGLLIGRHPEVVPAPSSELDPWSLVDHFKARGIIKGYILYDSGNDSVNIATSLAGLLDGIIIDESLESEAHHRQIKLLMDVRKKTERWCFQNYKDQFNRHLLCFQDPRRPHVRDLAVAQKIFTLYGSNEAGPPPGVARQAMAWLDPLSAILGWNCGDEFATTDLSSGYGHIQTSTDWCMNLPVLMAGTEKLDLPKAKSFDPRRIDWKDSRSGVSFVGTDGDNTQWMQGNFAGNKSYWSNPERGKIPFGWSCCFDHLAQACPETIEYLLQTCTTNDSFIEWGGGYYYPDRFARERTNRWELLANHARRTWDLMKKTGTRIMGFDVSDLDSPDAHKAYEIIAGQTDGLLAIFVFQYVPYEAGAGKVFWVKDKNGINVPVVSARYCLWANSNQRDHAGTPAKVARQIREADDASRVPRYDWVIAHAWSEFKHAPGDDEDAENIAPQSGEAKDAAHGYSPVLWCAEHLPKNIRIISPEEMIWRIRMQHAPSETRKLIESFQ